MSPKYFSRKLVPRQVVVVRWLDAHTIDDTYGDEDVKGGEAAPTLSAGFLVSHDDEGITLTTDVQTPLPSSDDKSLAYRGKHFIPTGMIYDVTVVRK